MVAHISELQPSITVQFSLVTQLCPTLCDPMDCRTPGFPLHHHLPELAQTHVRRISDAIQPSQTLVVPFFSCLQSLSASGFFPVSQLFASDGHSIGTSASASVLPMNIQFSLVTQLCPTLCHPMNSSTPGIPVHHQLLEFTQTHVH